MTPYYSDAWLTIHAGDCREVMATMPAESVHCVVTSPPYWGLRDYGMATWEGGDEGCAHRVGGQVQDSKWAGAITTGQRPGADASRCRQCGAIRQDAQLGLEATPEAYVASMVEVFREVRRVLRSDGSAWLNLGDSYATMRNDHEGGGFSKPGTRPGTAPKRGWHGGPNLKAKDLVGIPWRVAFALQADGWYLRSDIIWSKPNPMPESVTDRPTKSHEYLFLLTKSPRYYFDADAVREAGQEWSGRAGTFARNGSVSTHVIPGQSAAEHRADRDDRVPAGRNIRSVWTIATRPYPGAHFAVFPPALVEPCIKAGCPERGVVLDPFAGSGTVGMVAQRLSRRAVLIDLNPEYLAQQLRRNADLPLGLTA